MNIRVIATWAHERADHHPEHFNFRKSILSGTWLSCFHKFVRRKKNGCSHRGCFNFKGNNDRYAADTTRYTAKPRRAL